MVDFTGKDLVASLEHFRDGNLFFRDGIVISTNTGWSKVLFCAEAQTTISSSGHFQRPWYHTNVAFLSIFIMVYCLPSQIGCCTVYFWTLYALLIWSRPKTRVCLVHVKSKVINCLLQGLTKKYHTKNFKCNWILILIKK